MLTYRRHFSLWGPVVDRTADLLANYASSLTYEDLTPEAAHHVRRRLLDSLGCALGAYDSEPARIARKLAAQVSHTHSQRTSLDRGKPPRPTWRPLPTQSWCAT